MNKRYHKQFHLLKVIASFTALLLAGWSSDAKAQALYWNTNGTTGLTWTGPSWGTTDAGPFNTAWVSGSDVVFGGSSAATGSFSTTTVNNMTINTDTTITKSGSVTWKANTGGTVTVAAGKTLTWQSQNWSTAAPQIITKSGAGTWDMGANNNSLVAGSSFTLNSGTVIISGDNSFGGANSTLNING